MSFKHEIHFALQDEDIVRLEQIIKKVGAKNAFGVFLTEDFTFRTLIHYMENYPSGLRNYRSSGIHPEFLTLALKYDPYLTLGDRLRYLQYCDSRLARGIDEKRMLKFRKAILDITPADKKILMEKLRHEYRKENYRSN